MLRGKNSQFGNTSGSPSKKMSMEKLKKLILQNFPEAELKVTYI